MVSAAVDGLVFDLDNTLHDREATFRRVAEDFFDEYLLTTGTVTREEAGPQ